MYLNERVVEQEHRCSRIPNPFPIPVKHLTNIAHISDLWVTKTEFPDDTPSVAVLAEDVGCYSPDNQGGVEDGKSNSHSDNETRNQAQDRVRVRE